MADCRKTAGRVGPLAGTALGVSAALALVVPGYVTAAFADASDITGSARLAQPSVSHTFAEDELAVVNFAPDWGNKDANVKSMEGYIEKAHEKGTKILLFPEMCVTGYAYSSNPHSKAYKMPVREAEDLDGPTQKAISALADEYDMWVVYGGTQKVYGSDGKLDTQHAYNSEFACSPDGEATAYQKISPVEGSWCTPGTTPTLIDAGEYGKLGLSICYDTYATPELGRYYAAQGCTLLIHPTATGGNAWYRETRIGSYTDRDGMAAITCNLLGVDGPTDEDGKLLDAKNGYDYESTSLIITKYHDSDGNTGWDRSTGYAIDLNGTGTESAGYETRKSSPAGLEVAKMDLSGCGFSIANFNPRLFSKMYDRLAQLYRGGYTSIYPGESLTEPATVKLGSTKGSTAKAATAKAATAKAVTSVTVNKAKVTGKVVRAAVTRAGSKLSKVKTVTLGSKVKTVAKGSFKGMTALRTVRVPKKSVKAAASKVVGKNVKVTVK